MKIGIVGDVHWSRTSSILVRKNSEFTLRLENLIKTINWCEETLKSCDRIVYLGDFFDRKDINAEEATALRKVVWNDRPHHFIVGNHEANTASLSYKSTDVLNHENFFIEDMPTCYSSDDLDIYMIPYISEDLRKPLTDYLDPSKATKTIIFSHNDIKGINYGPVVSQEGFALSEIEQNCDLFINGHIHNGSFVNAKKTILNLGNITGQNFSEDAFTYEHHVAILDTDSLNIEFIENPEAFNFYKIQITKDADIRKLNVLKPNAVVSIRCNESLVDKVRETLPTIPNIVESRVTVNYEVSADTETHTDELLKIDSYLDQFISFIKEHIAASDILNIELAEVCK